MRFSPFSLFRSRAFAIDVSDHALVLLQLSRSARKPRVLAQHRLALEPGLVENGEILNQEEFAKAIEALVSGARPRSPKTDHVVMSLPESITFMKHFTVPSLFEKEELDQEVIRQAERSMPLYLDDYAWDFEILNKKEDAQEILFAAASKEVVEAYAHVTALAGIELAALVPESLAIIRALTPMRSADADGVVIFDMGSRSTHLLFFDQNGLWLSVTLPLGGNTITKDVAKKADLSEKAADSLKKKKGMDDAHVQKAVDAYLDTLSNEYQQAFSYYTERTGKQVSQVILTGGTSLLNGLMEAFAKKISTPIEQALLPVDVGGLPPAQSAAAAGLAMRAAKLKRGFSFVVPD